MLFVADTDKAKRNAQRRASSGIAKWATDDPDITIPMIEGKRVLKSFFTVGDVPRYIKFETSIIDASADGLVEPREVKSMMCLQGESAWVEEHPELGGFVMPCAKPAWIAVNKFDALHRRAQDRNHDGIKERGRDLYDLWALAIQPPVADEIRKRMADLWEPAAAGLGRNVTPRPAGGYADSPVFQAGTAAYSALQEGFDEAVATTVWGAAPKFETAVKAVCALDDSSI